jgi:hypothetical protein
MRLAGGLLLLMPVAASAQWPGDQEIPPVRYPDLPRHSATLAGFVPREWKLEQKAVGDLNGDRRPDAALVLHMASARNRIAPSFAPDTRYDTNPRMLAIVFANARGGYDLIAADHKLIPRRENPNQDEPFDSVKIANGTVRLNMHEHFDAGGWRLGTTSFTFRWQDGTIRLIGFDRDAIIKGPGETEVISVNYPARRMVVTKGMLDASAPDRTETITLPEKPLLKLAEVGDGFMFEPCEQ